MGLPTWLRGTHNSSGTSVADLTGGFNGQYIRYLHGSTVTVAATLAGIDASVATNSKWRALGATRATSTIDLTTCQTIRRGMERTSSRRSPCSRASRGSTTDAVVFMSQNDHDVYKQIVEDGPDDRNGDVFPFRTSRSVRPASCVLRSSTATRRTRSTSCVSASSRSSRCPASG